MNVDRHVTYQIPGFVFRAILIILILLLIVQAIRVTRRRDRHARAVARLARATGQLTQHVTRLSQTNEAVAEDRTLYDLVQEANAALGALT